MNPFRLLIGYDGSPTAEAALLDLTRAGLPETVHARVVCIADTLSMALFRPKKFISEIERTSQEDLDKAYALALEGASKLRNLFPGWRIEPETYSDDPAWGLIKIAHAWKPDLIQLGSRGRSSAGRFFLGSVARKILAHVHFSVRIVPAHVPKSVLPNRLVIGFDSSAESRHAVAAVIDRQWPAATEAELLTVTDTRISTLIHLAMAGGKHQGATYGLHYWEETLMQPLINKLQAAGIHASAKIMDGDPHAAILKEAKRWKASQIFLGDRGLTGIERVVLGGVSAVIAASAFCAVEIVRDSSRRSSREPSKRALFAEISAVEGGGF